jgi:hypothetical protein
VAGDCAVDLVEILRLDKGVGGDGSKLDGIVHRGEGRGGRGGLYSELSATATRVGAQVIGG